MEPKTPAYCARIRQVHYKMAIRCLGRRKRKPETPHPLYSTPTRWSRQDSRGIEATVRRRRVLLAGSASWHAWDRKVCRREWWWGKYCCCCRGQEFLLWTGEGSNGAHLEKDLKESEGWSEATPQRPADIIGFVGSRTGPEGLQWEHGMTHRGAVPSTAKRDGCN